MRTDAVGNQTGYDWRRDGWLAACALTAVLLVVSAATPHAGGFNTFLRAFIFCIALVRAFAGFRRGGAWLPLSAAVIAILFNPARPIAMSPVAWIWCDLIAAAWFAIVGAWRLLVSWEPQRGWAAAALSLGAVAVPAVASMSVPNRDKLTPVSADENLAVMNATSNHEAPPADSNAVSESPVATSAPAAPRAKRPSSDASVTNAPALEASVRPKNAKVEGSAENVAVPGPPTPSTIPNSPGDEILNNESEGNQE